VNQDVGKICEKPPNLVRNDSQLRLCVLANLENSIVIRITAARKSETIRWIYHAQTQKVERVKEVQINWVRVEAYDRSGESGWKRRKWEMKVES
jgi:hypothetical protein